MLATDESEDDSTLLTPVQFTFSAYKLYPTQTNKILDMWFRRLVAACVIIVSDGFSVLPSSGRGSTALRMGLFDGVKEAFSAPALERSAIDSERETPIDRWMGWSVVSENQQEEGAAASAGTFMVH